MCCPNLEALFINCKPFYSPQEFSSFILVSVYIPPDAHVSAALELLAAQITHTEQHYPDSFIIILGDFNKANLTVNCLNIDSTSHAPPETAIYWTIVTLF